MSGTASSYPKSAVECSFSRTYHADLSMIGIIRNDVHALNEYQLLDDEKRDALIIIITEMMTNAIKHGSRGIENALVILGISKIEDTLICIFEDSGPGFDRSSIPDPTLPAYIHRDHGRGIFITEHLADEVRYLHADNSMRIIVKL
jgi:serine/threonine-protein kinase RsbW